MSSEAKLEIYVDPVRNGPGFVLMCRSYGSHAPAGPRLFRGPPHPAIDFYYPTRELAEIDAAKLRTYLDRLPKTKPSSSKPLA